MNILQFILDLKNLSPAKRNFVLLIGLFLSMNLYLYNENQSLKEQNKNYETKCSEMLEKAQNDYLIQLNKNREAQQKQLTDFYIKTNKERDSIYINFEKRIQVLRSQINRGIKDLNYIKNESTN